jgi:hypothetical protein
VVFGSVLPSLLGSSGHITTDSPSESKLSSKQDIFSKEFLRDKMRKLFLAALIIAATFSAGLAQQGPSETKPTDELLKMGRAPNQPEGIGRAVIDVEDEQGNPIPVAFVTLSSVWGGDQFCESYGQVNSDGVIALLPIHMGKLKLKVKAKGYRTYETTIDPAGLNEPVVVKLVKK